MSNDTCTESKRVQQNGEQNGINRRRILRIAGGVTGISGIGLARARTTDDTTEIPLSRDHDGIARTATIPRKAYEYDEHVKQLTRQLSERKTRDENIGSVMVTGSKKTINSHPVTKLKVGVPDSGDASKVPDSIESVPVEKVSTGNFQPGGHGSCHNTDSYDPVLGGVELTAQDGQASAFGKVMDMSNGEPRYMTCAHVAEEKDDVGCGTGEGDGLWQGGNYIGEVDKGSVDGDWAIARETSDDDIEGYDRDVLWKGYGRRDFAEFYTEEGLREVMKGGVATYKMGLTSGSTEGLIDSMYADDSYWCTRTVDSSGNPYGVVMTVPGGNGDSGSPVFTKYPDNPTEQLSAVGHWVAFDDESTSYDTGCSPAWYTTKQKAYERTLSIPSYYLDNEYSIQPWLL